MNPPYADKDDRTLQVGICEDLEHVFLRVTDGDAIAEVCITRSDLPEVLGQMCKTAGPGALVILERPGDPRASLELFGTTFSLRPDAAVEVTVVRGGTQSGTRFEPEVIRHWAAMLAALADEAENQPDPADVAELTEEIRDELNRTRPDPEEACEIAARTAIRWMKQREAAT